MELLAHAVDVQPSSSNLCDSPSPSTHTYTYTQFSYSNLHSASCGVLILLTCDIHISDVRNPPTNPARTHTHTQQTSFPNLQTHIQPLVVWFPIFTCDIHISDVSNCHPPRTNTQPTFFSNLKTYIQPLVLWCLYLLQISIFQMSAISLNPAQTPNQPLSQTYIQPCVVWCHNLHMISISHRIQPQIEQNLPREEIRYGLPEQAAC